MAKKFIEKKRLIYPIEPSKWEERKKIKSKIEIKNQKKSKMKETI